MEIKVYTVEQDNNSNIKFSGTRLGATQSSSDSSAGSNYSGETGKHEELGLYRTQSGSYICERIEKTQWQGERDVFSALVCDSIEEAITFFGHGWLAKDLYASAKIETSRTVA